MDFYPAASQIQNPDVLGAYVRGQIGAQQVQAGQQQLTAGSLDIDKLRMALQQQKQVMGYASQLAGQSAGAQNQGGPSGGTQNGPQGDVSAQAPQQPSGSYDGSFGGNPRVNTMMALDVLQGRDPLKTAQAAQEYSTTQKKLQLQGPMNLAQRIATDPQANIVISKNPSLMAAWRQWAAQRNLNPDDPTNLTVANAQASAKDYYSQLAAQVGQKPEDFGFSGKLSPGEVAYQGGKQIAGSPDSMTAYQKAELSNTQQRLSLDRSRLAFDQSHKDIPGGYEPDPGTPGSIRPIAGGPHDPNAVAAGLDSRSGVMFQRVASSAQAAVAAIKNIGELPVTSSSGWFGTAQPGTGLISSAKSVLAQKVTGQEAQDYKTMVAGVSRNLATIETAGLAPNGSLTHSMDSITLNEGDTQMTKLRKMAEMRQIIEENLKPQLANPRIPPPQKQLLNTIISNVQEAVPFTHHDITSLQQSKNPQATIMDFAGKQGLGSHPQAIQSLLDKYK